MIAWTLYLEVGFWVRSGALQVRSLRRKWVTTPALLTQHGSSGHTTVWWASAAYSTALENRKITGSRKQSIVETDREATNSTRHPSLRVAKHVSYNSYVHAPRYRDIITRSAFNLILPDCIRSQRPASRAIEVLRPVCSVDNMKKAREEDRQKPLLRRPNTSIHQAFSF